ncbi:hypothetical protein FZC76_00675 [Sutcliffiella horikoshii]|uniref:Uncharacterized protein n=1 Tax=Sutcliffiella horikoshii TaxID=79883 RepID=A0A5D4T536_9BACI|nr:hypothetical protein [Sutcliffiella horikoshii]TYS70445.1 hypothetical protein FZC76_00675 [Sutcliffiella horikoshii]
MKSLSKVSFDQVVKKQFLYKLSAYSGVFISLIILQVIAVLFSLNGVGNSSGGSELVRLNIHYYSANLIFVFTMLWVFIVSIIITSKAYRNDDFSFVTNRLSSDLSNVCFVVLVSTIGTITALMSKYLLQVIVLLLPKFDSLYHSPVSMNIGSFLVIGILTAFLYVLLCGAAGYFVGTLVRVSSLFKILVPVLFVGYLFFGGFISQVSGLANIVEFFYLESSFIVFVLKVLITVLVLFASSVAIFNRMEVRQ